jgi:hypothetical protein
MGGMNFLICNRPDLTLHALLSNQVRRVRCATPRSFRLARHPPTILATEGVWQLKHRISLQL